MKKYNDKAEYWLMENDPEYASKKSNWRDGKSVRYGSSRAVSKCLRGGGKGS